MRLLGSCAQGSNTTKPNTKPSLQKSPGMGWYSWVDQSKVARGNQKGAGGGWSHGRIGRK